jgi:hypothetical protein
MKLTENWRQNPSTTILGKINKSFDNFKIILEINLLKEFGKSFEDARLVSFQDNEITLIGTVWNFDQNEACNSREVAHQAILKLNVDGRIVFFAQPSFGHNLSINKYEKNWVPIIGSTNFVYSLNPNHIVFDLGKGSFYESPGISWEFGTPHCGSQVVELPDSYFAIYHSSIETAVKENYSEQVRFVRRYFIGAYKFSKSAPFSIIQSTKVPILTASLNNPFVKNSPISLLAHGLALDEKHVVISLGVNDAASAIVRLPTEEIVKLLVEN